MKNYILLIGLGMFLLLVSCSHKEEDSNSPIILKFYFHNKENENKFSTEDLDITIEYTNPKGKTTIATNDELDNGAFTFKIKNGYGGSNDCFRKINEPNAEGFCLFISSFPVNYPDDTVSTNQMGAVMKFKIILRKKGDDKIIFENSFICTFKNEKGNPFVGVDPVEVEKPDLENIKRVYATTYHIYLD